MSRGRCTGAGLALALMVGAAAADDPKAVVDAKAFDRLVVDSLKEVHNRGADLYNTGNDFVGAYRMYEGGLLAVRPLLGHRPDEQKAIDEGVAAAEKETDLARKAFTETSTEDPDMAAAAISGVTSPAIARGTATRL